VITIIFFSVCVVWGLRISLAQWDQLSPGLQISMTWAYLSVPVSFAIMTLFSFELLAEDISGLFSREGKI
jgi:TRAP-type C4-dicarboxylate transport system permease small subunit